MSQLEAGGTGILVTIEEYNLLREENNSLRRVLEMVPPPPHLRDYFAAAALQGHRANPDPQAFNASPDDLARWSYADADAMLKARRE